MSSAQFWQAVEEFNQEKFYACHDTLESIWLESIPEDKNFYQGVLQIAVACYHLGNSNLRGAIILLGEGVTRLRNYQPIYAEIDVNNLLQTSYHLLQDLQKLSIEGKLQDLNID
ncbi:MAG: DUF309 domain-containing protein, partial [Cyanobacteria bacterium J083]